MRNQTSDILRFLGSHNIKRIMADYRLPKSLVVHHDFFSTQFDLVKDYERYGEVLDHVYELVLSFQGPPDLFFFECSSLINSLKDYVSGELILHDMESIKSRYPHKKFSTDRSSSKDVYNSSFIDIPLIRIDIREACYTVFEKYTTAFKEYKNFKMMVLDSNIYDTEVLDYVANSKRLRNVIFGQTNAKVAIYLEKYMISLLGEKLNSYGIVDDIVMKSHDELIIKDSENNFDICRQVLEELGLESNFRTEKIYLEKFPYCAGIIEHKDGKQFLKTINSHRFLEVFAKYFERPIKDEYKVFEHDGSICKRLFES